MLAKRAPAKWLVAGADLQRVPAPPVDFQMHTTWTDGHSSVGDMVDAAIAKGLRAIAVTEHLNYESTYYPEFVSEVKQLRAQTDELEIYYGVEVAVCDYSGNLKTDLDLQRRAEWVIGVVHSYPKTPGRFWRMHELTAEEALRCELKALEGLAASSRVDVVGHPGGTYYSKFGPFPVERMERAFRIAKENNVAVEFNSRYCWDPAGFMELVRRVNPMVSFGSDAHRASEVGVNYEMLRRWSEDARRNSRRD